MTEGDEYPSTDYFEMVWHTIWEEERTGRDRGEGSGDYLLRGEGAWKGKREEGREGSHG